MKLEPAGEPVGLGRYHQRDSVGDMQSPDYNANVSRHHAVLTRDASGKYFIADTSSSYGTYIQKAGSKEWQQVIDKQELRPGDRVMMGGTNTKDQNFGSDAWKKDPSLRRGTELNFEAN